MGARRWQASDRGGRRRRGVPREFASLWPRRPLPGQRAAAPTRHLLRGIQQRPSALLGVSADTTVSHAHVGYTGLARTPRRSTGVMYVRRDAAPHAARDRAQPRRGVCYYVCYTMSSHAAAARSPGIRCAEVPRSATCVVHYASPAALGHVCKKKEKKLTVVRPRVSTACGGGVRAPRAVYYVATALGG